MTQNRKSKIVATWDRQRKVKNLKRNYSKRSECLSVSTKYSDKVGIKAIKNIRKVSGGEVPILLDIPRLDFEIFENVIWYVSYMKCVD